MGARRPAAHVATTPPTSGPAGNDGLDVAETARRRRLGGPVLIQDSPQCRGVFTTEGRRTRRGDRQAKGCKDSQQCGRSSRQYVSADPGRFARLGPTWRINVTGSAWARRAWPDMIRAGTGLGAVPLVPDLRIHQAGDPISLWQHTELQSGPTGLDPPFWAFAWAGGLALARYLLDHPETVRGRHVIDVASGSGVAAIAAARAGAATVTAYDIDPVATVVIGMNAAANGVTVPAVCADVLDQDNLPAPGADLVLVADAFYDRELAGQVRRLADRGHARGAAVLVGVVGAA